MKREALVKAAEPLEQAPTDHQETAHPLTHDSTVLMRPIDHESPQSATGREAVDRIRPRQKRQTW